VVPLLLVSRRRGDIRAAGGCTSNCRVVRRGSDLFGGGKDGDGVAAESVRNGPYPIRLRIQAIRFDDIALLSAFMMVFGCAGLRETDNAVKLDRPSTITIRKKSRTPTAIVLSGKLVLCYCVFDPRAKITLRRQFSAEFRKPTDFRIQWPQEFS